jgi:endonuclease YncB( thermonuclease family)
MNRTQTRVHLEGIDAPEWNQGFGERSKRALSDLLLDKIVVVKKTGEDRYGRTLGIVIVDGVDVNAKMIESGLAWHYKRYNKESRLAELETLARRAKRGLWADPDPLPPWEFRIRSQTPNGAPESSDGETLK